MLVFRRLLSNPPDPHLKRSGLLFVACLVWTRGAGAEPRGGSHEGSPAKAPFRSVGEDLTEAPPNKRVRESSRSRWTAVGAALVPGLVVHGSGSWVLGDEHTARSLVYAEGAGLGLLFGSGSGIVLSGASRVLVGPLAAGSVLGAGLFAVSWVADVYHVSVPLEYRGSFRARPNVETHVGYVFVDNPQFSMTHLLDHGAAMTFDRLRLAYQGQHAPDALYGALNAELSYRLWAGARHPSGRLDGSALDVALGGWRREFLEEDFRTRSAEVRVTLRTDTEAVMPSFPGAFSEFELGYARRSSELLLAFADQEDSLLIAGASFGAYLPGPGTAGGEAELYYNHRHDGVVGGMLAWGLGSGVLGRAGLRGHYYWGEHMGVGVDARVGSAWVLGLNLRFRDGANQR